MRITLAETPIPDELHSHEALKLWRDHPDNVVNALRMKIPTETLKVRREESRVRIIDLLCRIAPASFGPTDQRMRIFDLV